MIEGPGQLHSTGHVPQNELGHLVVGDRRRGGIDDPAVIEDQFELRPHASRDQFGGSFCGTGREEGTQRHVHQ